MPRHQPTPEQQQHAAERREAFKHLCQQVAAMSDDQRLQIAAAHGIITTEGHLLSPFNTCLLLSQFAGVPTIVGGFQQWRRKGRIVRKGCRGLMIWIPKAHRKAEAEPEPSAESQAKDPERTGFIMGYVFDVTQTDEQA